MSRAKKIWLGVGIGFLVLVVGGIGALAFLGRNNPALAEVGDCFAITNVGAKRAVTDELSRVDAQKASCSDPKAIYRVAQKLSNTHAACPTDAYNPYVQSGIGRDFKLCLGYNVATGECLEESNDLRSKIPCTSSPADGRLKVLQVVKGVARESACDSFKRRDIFAAVYPVPEPHTICFAAL